MRHAQVRRARSGGLLSCGHTIRAGEQIMKRTGQGWVCISCGTNVNALRQPGYVRRAAPRP